MNPVSKTESPEKSTHRIPDKLRPSHVRIYYVDDDSFVRSSLARRLKRRGYHVREFESGESVVTYIQEEGELPDVIILDYKMPGMDGLETFQAIRYPFPFRGHSRHFVHGLFRVHKCGRSETPRYS
ncbi:MAG: response regulator [Nitrospirales bacterium]